MPDARPSAAGQVLTSGLRGNEFKPFWDTPSTGGSGQAVTPTYAHPFEVTNFGDFADSVTDPTPPNNTWDPLSGFTALSVAPNNLWQADRSQAVAAGFTRWVVTRTFFAAPGTATGWGSRVIAKQPESTVRYYRTNVNPTSADEVQGNSADARYVQFWTAAGGWGALLTIDGRGVRWDSLGHLQWRPTSNGDTTVMTLNQQVDTTTELLFAFWVRVRGIQNISSTAYLANVLWYPQFVNSVAPGTSSPAAGHWLQCHTLANLSAYDVFNAVIATDNVLPARGQGQNNGFAFRFLPRRIAGNPAVSGTFQDILMTHPSVWGVNAPRQRFAVDISLLAMRNS